MVGTGLQLNVQCDGNKMQISNVHQNGFSKFSKSRIRFQTSSSPVIASGAIRNDGQTWDLLKFRRISCTTG